MAASLLLRGPPHGDPEIPDAPPAEQRSRSSERAAWLLCRACRHRVTTPAAAITRNGAHRHRFVNPAGMAFAIACYSDAPGTLTVGTATAEATWFAGYLWRFAVCRGCDAHLGWHYQGGSTPFFGLIHDRLRPG